MSHAWNFLPHRIPGLRSALHEGLELIEHAALRLMMKDAYDRLAEDVEQAGAMIAERDAKIADLEGQLSAANSKPAGASDDKLAALADKLEAAMGGKKDADPAPAPTDEGPALPFVVGPSSTTVTDPATGNVTTFDHASGSAVTTDASGAATMTDDAAVSAAKQAAQDAGAIPAT